VFSKSKPLNNKGVDGVGPLYMRILIAFIFSFLVAVNPGYAATVKVFHLRFIDSSTLQPISSQTFLIGPIIIMEKRALNSTAPDPNLQFAKPLATDSNGNCEIPESLILELTRGGKFGLNSWSDSWARFILSPQQWPKEDMSYIITTFRSLPDGRVAGTVNLNERKTNIILLESQERLK
jgi:hypothetical protein